MSFVIAFGAPVGGVILSLELFCDNFEMYNLMKSFLASGIAYFSYELTSKYFTIKNIDSIFPNQTDSTFKIGLDSVILFLGEGIFIGILATIFLYFHASYLEYKKNSNS